jgi:hypothetical protein
VLIRIIAKEDVNLVLRNTPLLLWIQSQMNEKWQNFIDDFAEMFPEIGVIKR